MSARWSYGGAAPAKTPHPAARPHYTAPAPGDIGAHQHAALAGTKLYGRVTNVTADGATVVLFYKGRVINVDAATVARCRLVVGSLIETTLTGSKVYPADTSNAGRVGPQGERRAA